MTIYQQLENKCLPFITDYKTDLTRIDREFIEANGTTLFIHLTRAWGTHIIPLRPFEAYPAAGERVPYLFGHITRNQLCNETIGIIEHFEKTHAVEILKVTYFNGHQLIDIDMASARRLIERYQRKIRAQFKRDNGARIAS